ncbi:MAG: hypothetical protein Kow0069_32950 [Promethearchaeota archaeon]
MRNDEEAHGYEFFRSVRSDDLQPGRELHESVVTWLSNVAAFSNSEGSVGTWGKVKGNLLVRAIPGDPVSETVLEFARSRGFALTLPDLATASLDVERFASDLARFFQLAEEATSAAFGAPVEEPADAGGPEAGGGVSGVEPDAAGEEPGENPHEKLGEEACEELRGSMGDERLGTGPSSRAQLRWIAFVPDLGEVLATVESHASPSVALVRLASSLERLDRQRFGESRPLVVVVAPTGVVLSSRFVELFDAQVSVAPPGPQARARHLSAALPTLDETGDSFQSAVDATEGWHYGQLDKLVGLTSLLVAQRKASGGDPADATEVLLEVVQSGVVPRESLEGGGAQLRPAVPGVGGEGTGRLPGGGAGLAGEPGLEVAGAGVSGELAAARVASLLKRGGLPEQLYQRAAESNFEGLSKTLEKLMFTGGYFDLNEEERALLAAHPVVLLDPPDVALVRLNRAKVRIDQLRKFFSKKRGGSA